MSTRGQSLGVNLGPAALKLSCEAADSSYHITVNGLEEFKYSMKVHFYRVVFETALYRLLGHKQHGFTIRCISRANAKTFETYTTSALARMARQTTPHGVIPTAADLAAAYVECEPHHPKISILLLLRGLIAPVLESLIILDRWLYLDESPQSLGIKSSIVPIFNETLSPRNYAIVSHKSDVTL
eukprot:gene15954-18968_t